MRASPGSGSSAAAICRAVSSPRDPAGAQQTVIADKHSCDAASVRRLGSHVLQAVVDGRFAAEPAVTPSGADAQQPPDSSGVGLRRSWDVSPERQRAIFEAIRDLLPRAGRMSPAQLRAATARIASRRELWADLVVHDPDVRR